MAGFIRVTAATFALDDLGEGPALLLLHGFPATRQLWSRVAPTLAAAGFRVLLPDLVGYGASVPDGDGPVDMGRQAQWLLELLDSLGLNRVAVVAHDVGSAAAQLMLVRARARVRALAILDGVYLAEWAMDAIASIQSWNPSEAHRLSPVLGRRLGNTDSLRALVSAYAGDEGGRRLIRAARDLDPRQTAHIGEALRASAVPALVLWGEHDRYLPADTVGRPLAALLEARWVLLPGGHFTPIDCPAEVASALLQFLRQLPEDPA
jgi:pimeloyl-ACP methyl ester carboxylesterase